MPDGEPGSEVTFKALQTYQGGEVVRWIGPPDADEPAPTVTLTAGRRGRRPRGPGQRVAEPASAPAPSSADDDGGDSDGLAIAALVVGALGLLAGIGALITARRTQTR